MAVGPIQILYVRKVTVTSLEDGEAQVTREALCGELSDPATDSLPTEVFSYPPRVGDVYLETRTRQSGTSSWVLFLVGNTGERPKPSFRPTS